MKLITERVDELRERWNKTAPNSADSMYADIVAAMTADRVEVVVSIARAVGAGIIRTCPCGKEFFFFPTAKGKFQPIVPEEAISHFATCEQAPHFKHP